MNDPEYHIETLALHAGQIPDPATQARAVPVYRTTAYSFKNSGHGADLFAYREHGNIYARLMNPTNDVLEKRLAALEGGRAAVTFGSGTAAIYFAVTNILRQGDELIAANNLYGGTFTQFDAILPQQGITTHFTAVNDFEAVEKAINERTRALYIETVGNPALDAADIERYAAVAEKHHLPLIVDSTFTPPTLLRTIEYGADIVVHSTTKYMDGHALQMGGVIVDGGTFDWTNGKFPEFTEPDDSYHGTIYTQAFGKAAYIVKARTQIMRDMGACQTPFGAFLINQGLETLPLRIERHSQNADAVAHWLEKHDKIESVSYPTLEGNPYKERAAKYLPNGCSGVISFSLKGGREAGARFIDSLKMASLLVHVADIRTCVLHPASSTHRQLTDEQLVSAGITPGMVRLSVGIENIKDILADLEQALAKA